jgi:hypothetical protein
MIKIKRREIVVRVSKSIVQISFPIKIEILTL